MRVVISVDLHKGSRVAVAIDADEQQLAAVQVRSGARQLEQLRGWAAEFDERRLVSKDATKRRSRRHQRAHAT